MSENFAEVDFDGQAVITLSHTFGKRDDFTQRGQINIRSLRTGQSQVTSDPLSDDDIQALKDAAETGQFYRIKADVHSQDQHRTFISSTKACLVYGSSLSDIITVSLDISGNIVGVSIAARDTHCIIQDVEVPKTFNTTVLISHTEPGPVPDVGLYVQRMEQEKLAKERGETKDNRSFFAKYWMYILPVVLLFMMSGGAGNAEQGSR
nr:EOG090X0JXR [Eulimnadia texana]